GRASETDILPSSLRPASVNDRLARGPSRTVCTTMDRSVATTLRTEDGLELPARWWHATDARAIVVLVHGFTASKDDPAVGAVAERMQSAGYAVMSYDARGHGASAGLSTLGDMERHDVAAAVEVVRQHGLPIVLVGASMGAIAVLRHAAAGAGLAGVVTV